MFRRIVWLWDIEEAELDPVVSLLVKAMAEKIFALAGELNGLDDRLLSKLSMSLPPASALTAQSSHAILSAFPVEPIFILNRDIIFTHKEPKSLHKYGVEQIDLIPVAPFPLFRANIRYLNIAGQIYEYDNEEGLQKHTVAHARGTSNLFQNSIWLGIRADGCLDNLSDLPVYFDFANVRDKYLHLQLLGYTRWSSGGEIIKTRCGIGTSEDGGNDNPYDRTAVESVFSELQSLYDIHYLPLCEHTATRSSFPIELKDFYANDVKNQFSEPLFWFRIDFPNSIYPEILENIRVGINCFPVANLSKKKVSEKMTDIPLFLLLETARNESFTEVISVSDTSGKVYLPVYSEETNDEGHGKGRYSLRKGGVERFSRTATARSSAARLTEIIRDRNLFCSNRQDVKFNKLVQETTELINKISDTLETSGEIPPALSYVLVEKSYAGEVLSVKYLTTNGAAINQFRNDISLIPNHEGNLEAGKIWLVTPLHSGRKEPSPSQVRNRHHYLLTSQNRIVTRQDVVNFCMAAYGDRIESIDVKPGYAVSKKPKEGLVRTKDISITLKRESPLKSTMEEMKTELLCRLERRSPQSFNYKLSIN